MHPLHSPPKTPSPSPPGGRNHRATTGHVLPSELYLLFIGPEEPAWTQLTLQLDQYGCDRPRFHWCSRLSEAARIVHQEHFDCLVIDDATKVAADAAPEAVASLPSALIALRTAGCLDPLLVLSDRIDDAWLVEMAEVDAELLVTRQGWRTAALIPWIRCAMDRQHLAREHREIGAQGRERRAQESTEVQRWLSERHSLATRLRKAGLAADRRNNVHSEEHANYLDLLRSAVLSDATQLQDIVQETVARLTHRELSALDLFELHQASLERLLQGLGGRSGKHVLQRTDLIGWELMMRLAAAAARGFQDVADVGLDLST